MNKNHFILDRRSFLQTTSAAALGHGLSLTSFATTSTQPNILFIMADDLNTALSGYGHPQCKTPNLDRLAEQGTVFTRAYCQFPLCGPSRASLFSGLYPDTNGVTGNGGRLAENAMTLPSVLRNSGYWTERVSKMYHMGVPGNIYTGDDGIDHAPSWDKRFNVSVMESLTPGKAEDVMLEDTTPWYDEYREEWAAYDNAGGKYIIPRGNHQGSDFVIVEADGGDDGTADGIAATKAIDSLRERAQSPQPFFLGVGFVRPHVPFVAPSEAFESYDEEDMILTESIEDDLSDIPAMAQHDTNESKYKLSQDDQRKVLRGYYASVTYVDQQVGRLLDELDCLGLRENTIVVFVSDHGFHLGEHSMWQKLSLMEESLRVPLIVSVPDQFRKGNRCDDLVELIDLFPTVLELTGHEIPEHLQGYSFARWFRDSSPEHQRKDAFSQTRNGYSLRTDRWAYMMYLNQGDEVVGTMLYDMHADSRQFTNLSGMAECTEIEAELHTRLQKRIALARQNGKE